MGKSKKTTTISSIKNNRGKLSPILVNFEHGTVNPEAFNAFDAKIKIGLPEDQNENSMHADEPQLKLEIKSDYMKYTRDVAIKCCMLASRRWRTRSDPLTS